MRTVPRLAVVLIVAGLIAGCGGSDKSGESPPELEEQLGLSLSGAGSTERQTQVENRIRDCMSAQGFEYTPVNPISRQQALTGKARISDEDFIKQFGYGISTLYGRGTTQSDPNDALRKSLSSADRVAYDRALWGEIGGVTFAEALDTGDFSELGGCTKKASEAVFGGGAVLAAVIGKLDELDEQIVQDKRMVDATERWSACMSEQGYRYPESDAIDEDLTKRFQRVAGAAIRPGATSSPDPASVDRPALTELQREEVKIAVADADCEKRLVTPVELVVRPQYEQQFRRQNRQLLTRVRPVGQ